MVDHDLIAQVYGMLYEQSVVGGTRLAIRAETSVRAIFDNGAGIDLKLDGSDGVASVPYDLVILATGYRRRIDRALLDGMTDWWTGEPPTATTGCRWPKASVPRSSCRATASRPTA